MENVRSLVDMNFPQAAAAEALKMADNKVGKALDVSPHVHFIGLTLYFFRI